MYQKSKSLWIKLLLVLTIVCCALGVWFSLPASVKESKIAKADTVDVTDTIDLRFVEGYSNMTAGADYSNYSGADDICLVGYVGDNLLNSASALSTGQCWVSSASKNNPTNNGGVNIMDYIYINGSSMSALSAANQAGTTSYAGTHWELAQGSKRAPALVETTSSSGLLIRICMAYSNAGEFEIVIKEGFQLLDVDGNTVTVSEDVTFKYKDKAVSKVQKGTDITDTVSIVNSSYGENQSQFVINLTPASALTSNAWWNINGPSLIAANKGVDIMNYIYINGQNIRTLSDDNRTNNTYPVDTAGGWLANSDQCRPVFVESTSGGIYVTVLHAFSGTKYTITLKAGFAMLNESGTMSTISEDVNFAYNAGSVAKQTDVTDTVSIVNSSYGENQSQFKIALNPASTLTSNAWWNINGSSLIAANNGVDIMNYIYINGENIRTLSDDNRTNNTYPVDTAGGWLANSDQCRPVFVESTADGIYVTVLHAFSGTKYTITLKAGFAILNESGAMSTVTEDVNFMYNAGTVSGVQLYTLTFEGAESKTVTNGEAIGELPAVPEKDGYTAIGWEIDGVAITAETVYNYGADKTAVAVYEKVVDAIDVTDTIGWETRDWGVTDGANGDHVALGLMNNGYIASASSIRGYWNDHAEYAASNNGCDIMEYILIDGVSTRAIVTQNATDRVYPTTTTSNAEFNYGGVFAPIQVQTRSSGSAGIWVRVLKEYKTSFLITIKAGFSLILESGETIVVKEDVSFKYANGSIIKVQAHVLTFDGADSKTVTNGEAIGELPAVPERSGYVGYWAIDGQVISAETVYSYGADKTAVAVYAKDVTDTVTVKGANHSTAQSMFKIELTPSSALTSNGWWNIYGSNLIAANNGVDIMNYIYVNGENIRALSDNNRTNNTYPVGSATGWLTNSDQCRPVFVETNGEGIYVTVLHAFSGESYTVTLKAGFTILTADGETSTITEDIDFAVTASGVTKIQEYVLSFEGTDETVTVIGGSAIGALPVLPEVEGKIVLGWAIDGVKIDESTVYNYGANKTATILYAEEYTLSFEGLDDTLTVFSGMVIGDLPEVPANAGYVGYWTIDGVRISSTSLYNFTEDKTAVAVYAKDITNTINLDYQPGFAGATTEIVFVIQEESGKYLKSATSVSGVWNFGYADYQAANGGVDILEYIYINGESVRSAVTKNSSGATSYTGDAGWLGAGGSCAPVFVEASATDGLVIRIYTGYSKEYFDISFKAGFSLINAEGATVSVEKDVNYKFINGEVKKGVLTDEELDELGGNPITLRNGNETYLEKSTVRLTLPALDSVVVADGLSQVFVGWTTDLENLSNLYPAGYKYEPTSETGTTLHAVWIGFEMQDGAAVRLSVDSSGLRFLTDIDKDAYKLGVEEGLILEAGTFVVPTDYLYFGAEFVHSSFSAGQYVEKKTDIWKVQDEAESVWTYAAAFVNISETQFSRSFSARGYLKINYTSGEGYIYTPYSEENNARSIYEVAAAAYDDYSTNALIQNYVNKVAEITWDEEHNFSATTGVKGNYEVVSISADGETFTVTIDGDVKSLLINGSRLAIGNGAHVAIGNFVYKFSGLTAVDGGYQFTVGAADELVGKVEDETLYFNSSDVDLDFFLNDFFKRHSGYTTEDGTNLKVNSTTAGVNSEEFFSHEWMSMAYYWYNSDDGYAEDRIAGLREFLSTVPVDDYGYVWTSNDNVLPNDAAYDDTIHRMGWPIPHAYTTRTAAWEFNSGTESWTSNVSAASSDNLLTANVSGAGNITFSSPSNFYSLGTAINRKRVHTGRAPLMQIDIRIDDATNVEDIYVWYTTSASKSFSEDKKVSVKDKAFLSYDIGNTTGAYNHLLFLPMYAETAWGESSSTYVYQIKIEIALKSGTTISGNVGLNSVRLLADTRQSNNNSILISSLRQDYDYTGDLEFLADNITRARKAMNFLMQMYDPDRKLNLQSYLVGHDGDKSGSAAYLKTSGSISNGYWDVTFMPEYDFQSNMYFYKAVADMAYLEGVLAANGISVDKSLATVKTATRSQTYGTSEYTYTADSLNTVANDVLDAMRANVSSGTAGGFWNASTGRFAAGYGADGNLYDYGYVAWNLEAIYYGIATDAQAASIMNWLETEEALYDFVFAPRSNTTSDEEMLNGQWESNDDGWEHGDNVQYGGATMYTSFYDLMARIEVNGVDNAYERLQAIQAWYKEVYDYYMTVDGADPQQFYRYYYENEGIAMQGFGTSGGIGLDAEFLESYLPLSSVAYGFFGIDSIDGKTLQIAPTLPTDLTYWGMENLAFNFVEYDLIAYKNGVQISSVRGDTAGLTLQIVLDYTAGQSVYVNGVKVSNPVTENGKVYVSVDMGATVVEVK